ncbi:hypothetical protein AXG93_2566s1110 [Marchantia polymorpha subsp. ruderalis]|uniref:F-box domain-containing protein n=1 Tax=Marchantia polymorpha subsp. ruderalis TaxID=1480154 RepID=A0A176VBP4_MARPO|nr:hypothetical protein AXG93_2566s1110 [Marchantia polymorpha subsp. ruderalis]
MSVDSRIRIGCSSSFDSAGFVDANDIADSHMDSTDACEEIPVNLQALILSFLPWRELLRLRVVCKKWNKLLRSRDFKKRWRGADPDQIPFCFADCKYGNSLYNPAAGNWSCYSPAFYTIQNEDGSHYKVENVRVMGAAHGLLLLQVLQPWVLAIPSLPTVRHDLFIMNPLDPLQKTRIPLLPELRHPYTAIPLGMVWNEITKSHWIVVQHQPDPTIGTTGRAGSKISTFHRYDVGVDEWDRVAKWPINEATHFQQPSVKEGRLFCLGAPTKSTWSDTSSPTWSRDRFCAFGLDRFEENWMVEPPPPQPLHFATLFHRGGRCFVAGGKVAPSAPAGSTTLKDFRIWASKPWHSGRSFDLRNCSSNNDHWIEIQRMPDSIMDKLNGVNDRDGKRRGTNNFCTLALTSLQQFTCTSNGNFVCVANSRASVAMLNLKTKLWKMLPTPIFVDDETQSRTERYVWFKTHYRGLWNLLDFHLCEPRVDVTLPDRPFKDRTCMSQY